MAVRKEPLPDKSFVRWALRSRDEPFQPYPWNLVLAGIVLGVFVVSPNPVKVEKGRQVGRGEIGLGWRQAGKMEAVGIEMEQVC